MAEYFSKSKKYFECLDILHLKKGSSLSHFICLNNSYVSRESTSKLEG